jgi:hypothetical protein
MYLQARTYLLVSRETSAKFLSYTSTYFAIVFLESDTIYLTGLP